jgi:hypothetical protein
MNLVIDALEFVNSFAQGIGLLVLSGVRFVWPAAAGAAEESAALIGWLALLTAGLAAAEVLRKLAWVAVGVGWLLVTIRIVLGVVGR